MLHYDSSPRHAAQNPSPTCPKCGSHRTEVVDRTDDGRSVTVRCNACGERSSVLIDRRASDADNMTDEVEAIRTIARALAQLPDTASRARVMRWASERFQIDLTYVAASAVAITATAPLAAVARQADVPDPTLSMDGLHELFHANISTDNDLLDDLAPVMANIDAVVERPCEEAPRLESMVRTLVTDFQKLALDLDTVFATPVPTSR